MRFVLATLGTRGDIEPCAAIGRELQRRGHDVLMAVPPNYVGFIESAGLAAVAHGPDQVRQNAEIARKYGTTPNAAVIAWEIFRDITHLWPELGTALTSLADGADLLLTDASEQGLAPSVAEYYHISQAAVHIYPIAPGETHSPITKEAEDGLRRALGLSAETGPSTPQPLEVQAYDELFFPRLAAEWAECAGRVVPLARLFLSGACYSSPHGMLNSPSCSVCAICATAACARTLLPASSSSGENAAIASRPGTTATNPPPTPLLAGNPTV